ncbi:MAG: acyl--CoA ligase, partial [Gammaproteobacteria bacterium]|nr:acyl--CoA ligase [Gammaproteobacteria bacterium]
MQILDRFRAAALISEKGYGTGADRCDVDAELARLRHAPVHYALQPLTPENAGSPLFGNSLKAQPQADIAALPAQPDPDTLVYLALTSGTTGAPKGVMHSDNTLLANARAIAADWHFNSASVIYTLSPFSHNLGFGAMVTALYSGAEAVLSQLAPGESLVDDLLRTGATFIYGVPAHAVDLLMELKEPEKKAPEKITGFRISGAQAPADVAAELLEYGIKPQTGYGMTEAHSHNYT